MTAPSVVALGGGHGLAASLLAARRYAGTITAIVSVADNGGSSGRLRDAMPQLPAPGDVRRCLSALAGDESALARTLEHRFDDGDDALAGHAFGNLLLAALTHELGGFPAAVDEVAQMVGAVGRVLPATVGAVSLEGWLAPGERATAEGVEGSSRVVGQVAVQNSRGLARLSLDPTDPPSPDGVAEAILDADQVLVGPGSLFTSVLAAAIVPTVRDALAGTTARRVYVANLRPQVPETEGFDLADHLRALHVHGVVVDVVLCEPGLGRTGRRLPSSIELVEAPVAADGGRVHDPARLAAALATIL